MLFDRERFAISRYTTDLDVATRLEQSSVGRKRVPDTGAVAEPLSDDPDFPVACVFSFDIATSASDGETYLFSIGPLDDPIYFPIPIIPRADLEAAGWITNIGVNPQ